MNVLALDLATKTGYALHVGTGGGYFESGVEDFSKKRGESNGMLFVRFNGWLKRTLYTLSKPRFNMVVYEMPHHRGGAATEIAVGLATRVQEFCTLLNIEYSPVHSATLKKWATGNGRASKEQMIAAAIALRNNPQFRPDDNEADAVLLLYYAVSKILGENSWNVRSAREQQELQEPENIRS